MPSANPAIDAKRRRSLQRSFVFVVAVQRDAVLDVGWWFVGGDWLVLVLVMMMVVVAVVPVASLRLATLRTPLRYRIAHRVWRRSQGHPCLRDKILCWSN
jgi:hypothetical protein